MAKNGIRRNRSGGGSRKKRRESRRRGAGKRGKLNRPVPPSTFPAPPATLPRPRPPSPPRPLLSPPLPPEAPPSTTEALAPPTVTPERGPKMLHAMYSPHEGPHPGETAGEYRARVQEVARRRLELEVKEETLALDIQAAAERVQQLRSAARTNPTPQPSPLRTDVSSAWWEPVVPQPAAATQPAAAVLLLQSADTSTTTLPTSEPRQWTSRDRRRREAAQRRRVATGNTAPPATRRAEGDRGSAVEARAARERSRSRSEAAAEADIARAESAIRAATALGECQGVRRELRNWRQQFSEAGCALPPPPHKDPSSPPARVSGVEMPSLDASSIEQHTRDQSYGFLSALRTLPPALRQFGPEYLELLQEKERSRAMAQQHQQQQRAERLQQKTPERRDVMPAEALSPLDLCSRVSRTRHLRRMREADIFTDPTPSTPPPANHPGSSVALARAQRFAQLASPSPGRSCERPDGEAHTRVVMPVPLSPERGAAPLALTPTAGGGRAPAHEVSSPPATAALGPISAALNLGPRAAAREPVVSPGRYGRQMSPRRFPTAGLPPRPRGESTSLARQADALSCHSLASPAQSPGCSPSLAPFTTHLNGQGQARKGTGPLRQWSTGSTNAGLRKTPPPPGRTPAGPQGRGTPSGYIFGRSYDPSAELF
eukprot:Hpha_TRINITY_DN16472_c0_g5::TRINITY_DN16472_c0_g5_i2::g.160702::m.160702